MNDVHLIAYSLCAWGAGLNAFAWTRLLLRQLKPPRVKPWWNDPRFVNRIGLVLASFGLLGMEGSRALTAIWTNTAVPTPAPVGFVAIWLMAIAEPMFLRIDEIHAREVGQKSVNWRLYWIGAAVGVGLLLAWRMFA